MTSDAETIATTPTGDETAEAKAQTQAHAEAQQRARALLATNPAVERAYTKLATAIHAYTTLSHQAMEQEGNTLVDPTFAQRIYQAQIAVARNLDILTAAMRHIEDNIELQTLCMGLHQDAIAYVQGMLFSIHYGRMTVHPQGHLQPYEYLMTEAYQALQKQQQATQPTLGTPQRS